MTISPIDIDRLFAQALPGATVTLVPGTDKTYRVHTTDGTKYRVALSERSRVRQPSKSESFSNEHLHFLIHAPRVARLEKEIQALADRNLNHIGALAWVVTNDQGDYPLELIMASLSTLRQIAKMSSSPFRDNPSGIDYQWDRFSDAAQYPEVFTASIE